ncbi:hypothetical protein [Neisseria sp. N177_16]|uniref:hypothetical protein n=1 Tax=Neisseria sp. N177_16 TaxID=2056175 RepID=UPI0018E280E3|nr:hypothetical protein [Neisseria sp. N177_16]
MLVGIGQSIHSKPSELLISDGLFLFIFIKLVEIKNNPNPRITPHRVRGYTTHSTDGSTLAISDVASAARITRPPLACLRHTPLFHKVLPSVKLCLYGK